VREGERKRGRGERGGVGGGKVKEAGRQGGEEARKGGGRSERAREREEEEEEEEEKEEAEERNLRFCHTAVYCGENSTHSAP